MLGKRGRPSSVMKRTTSVCEGMTSVDMKRSNNTETYEELMAYSSLQDPAHAVVANDSNKDAMSPFLATSNEPHNQTPIHHPYLIQTPHFLKSCFLCKRPLASNEDIYMYRGDTAFCSWECRELQIEEDQRKWNMATADKKDYGAPPPFFTIGNASNNNETTACN